MSAKEIQKPDFMTEEEWAGILDAVSSLGRIRSDGRAHRDLYLSNAEQGYMARTGPPALLLTTIGRKSGKEITTPLNFMQDGDNYVVVGSLAGYNVHPHWALNLEKNPRAWVQVKDKRMAVTARKATGEERSRIWVRLLEVLPLWGVFQQRTQREFSVFILSPEK
jgi:deazaflavin-dependent oxidoreductase (nitroreductase family)